MMLKRHILLLFFAVVEMLASCDLQVDCVDDGGKAADATAVGFEAYVYRGISTKAGKTGELTGVTIQSDDAGFGVFGYASQGLPYNELSKPGFMYNQPVKYQSGRWTYEPVKYWPNEENAIVSFFAYAPFAEVTPSTGVVSGDASSGILGITDHQAAGDPQVRYATTLIPGRDVDLCWGIPHIDKTKPKTGDKLQFEFHHALSQLNVQIDTDIDADSQSAQETRVYVRSVSFTGFTTRGSLNLNSTDAPIWNDMSGTTRPKRDPVTVYDGRIDGAEGRTGSSDAAEKLATLNPNIIQTKPFALFDIDGVTSTTVNLFQNSEPDAPVLVVPLAGSPMAVSIVYDVETADSELTGRLSDGVTPGISVENRITQEVKLSNGEPLTLEAGKRYVVNLHLGLTGVKFSASMTEWDDKEYAKTDMPANQASFDIELSKHWMTLWRFETPSLPTVTVLDKNHQEVTPQSLTWESDNTAVARVAADGSSITLGGSAGVARLKVTVTYDNYTKSAYYIVYVNEVTGLSVSPDKAYVDPAGTSILRFEMAHTEYGTISTWPTVTWVSDDTGVATLGEPGAFVDSDGVAVSLVEATGVAQGVTLATVSIDSRYMASGVSNRSGCEINCVVMSTAAYRGYEVSSGILYKKDDGSYDLTDGSDPFELYGYYHQSSSIGKYYHNWTTLKNYYGSDGRGGIKVDSDMLPVDSEGHRWTFPSAGVWMEIINGQPKTPIVVNGQNVAKGYAFVSISHGGRTYSGLLLLRDGMVINCASLTKVGQIAHYSENALSSSEFAELKAAGCLFVMSTGVFQYADHSVEWWYGEDEGHYYTATYTAKANYLRFDDGTDVSIYTAYTNASAPYLPVRLVHLVNAN